MMISGHVDDFRSWLVKDPHPLDLFSLRQDMEQYNRFIKHWGNVLYLVMLRELSIIKRSSVLALFSFRFDFVNLCQSV